MHYLHLELRFFFYMATGARGRVLGSNEFHWDRSEAVTYGETFTKRLLPTIYLPMRDKIMPKAAAWTSICQEKWEGELVVQGEIPLWLVQI